MYLWILQYENTVHLSVTYFDMAKFTVLNLLLVLISCKLPFLTTIFAVKFPNRIFKWYKRNWLTLLFHMRTFIWIIMFILTFRITVSHQWPLTTVYYILLLTKSNFLTSDMIMPWWNGAHLTWTGYFIRYINTNCTYFSGCMCCFRAKCLIYLI